MLESILNTRYLSNNLETFALLVLLNVIGSILFVPSSIFPLTYGFVFGPIFGALFSAVSSSIASATIFLLTKKLSKYSFVSKKIKKLKKTIFKNGLIEKLDWKAVALVNLNPLLPASSMAYLFGLSGIKIEIYLLTYFLCCLPNSLLIAFIGSTFSSNYFVIASIAASAMLAGYLYKISKK
jgi:uncharacterized membrane protein YdjX (TVP38/TMEM64 family)